jgi:hypothetical protein
VGFYGGENVDRAFLRDYQSLEQKCTLKTVSSSETLVTTYEAIQRRRTYEHSRGRELKYSGLL